MPPASTPGTISAKKWRTGRAFEARDQRRRPHAQQGAADECELANSREHDRAREDRARDRRGADAGEEDDDHRREHHHVEDDEAEGRRPHAPLGIEHRGRNRDETGDRHIGHRQPHEFDRVREPLARIAEARRDQVHDRRREQDADERDQAERHRHGAEHVLAKSPRAARAALRLDAQPHRHEGGVERAFGQEPPEQVGDLQRREEGVGQHAGAEHRRNADVAEKADQPRQERRAADGGDVAGE